MFGLARAWLQEALSSLGVLLQELQRFDQALASFDKALTIRSDDVVTLNRRVICRSLLDAVSKEDEFCLPVGEVSL